VISSMIIIPIVLLATFLLWGLLHIMTPIYYKFVKLFDNKLFNSEKNKAWRQFAESNNLCFKLRGIYDDELIIDGNFHGYSLSISSQRDLEYGLNTIFVLKRNKTLKHFEKRQTDRDIKRSFWAVYNIFKSGISIEITLKRIFFRSNFIKSTNKLQSISDQLVNLIEIFPEVCKIGGEAVDSLLQDKSFEPIIWQFIEGISTETELRIKPKTSLLLCKKCFTFCSSHNVISPPDMSSLTPTYTRPEAKYYGCRICRQSRDFIEGLSISVIDNLMTKKWSVQENEILMNWLTFRKPFDFHEIRIIQASDREVEEFVMQAGNDMDEFRQPRYKEMPCIISSDCKLSPNTLNILKHTFKSVKEM